MSDLIERQAAIDIVSGYAEQLNGYIGSPNDSEVYAYARGLILSIERNINAVRPVQPTYTDTEIQKMHDMEQTQLDKAFELGREDAKPQWIPCSERLPEDKTAYYLATVANRGLFFTTTVNNNVDCVRWDYDRRKGQDSWHWCTERTVIAWMPLPEPYREEGEQE